MSEDLFKKIAGECAQLSLSCTAEELAQISIENHFDAESLCALDMVMNHLAQKKHQALVDIRLKTSRLPLQNPKTFSNFDFSRLYGQDKEKRSETALYAVYAGEMMGRSANLYCPLCTSCIGCASRAK